MLRGMLDRMRLRRLARLKDRQEDAQTRKRRALFAGQYTQVLSACRLLSEENPNIQPRELACRYMNLALREYDAAWWEENQLFLCDAWFVYEYACRHGLIRRTENPLPESFCQVIRPEQENHPGMVEIHVLRHLL